MTSPDLGHAATRRWDDDERGTGVADASSALPRIAELQAHAGRPAWVAERPEAHLWPHLEQAIGAAGSPWTNASWRVDPDGRLVVELEHRGSDGERPFADLRADVFALLGRVAETSTFVRVVEVAARSGSSSTAVTAEMDDRVEVEVVTGLLDDETPFASHGHTLRLRIARVAPAERPRR